MVPLCIVVCHVGARLTAVRGAALCPVVLLLVFLPVSGSFFFCWHAHCCWCAAPGGVACRSLHPIVAWVVPLTVPRTGGQAGGTGGGARHGHPGAPPDRGRSNPHRGRSNTDTQNAGATPRGTRASTADKEEGHSKAGEATRTAGTGNQNGACAWEAATIKGMAWPASPVATGCQGNPCSTGIRWGVSPAAQMGCLRNRSRSPSGADQP